jgi:hypothetical protein
VKKIVASRIIKGGGGLTWSDGKSLTAIVKKLFRVGRFAYIVKEGAEQVEG